MNKEKDSEEENQACNTLFSYPYARGRKGGMVGVNYPNDNTLTPAEA
jgi:hypothetical protein